MPAHIRKIIFGILAVIYLSRGFYHFYVSPEGGTDFEKRSKEAKYFLDRVDPYALYLQCRSESPPSHKKEECDQIKAAGYPSAPVYPPWALPLLALVCSFRIWFVLLNLVALFYLIRSLDVSVLAISTLGTNLGVGQLGVLLVSLLTGAKNSTRKVFSSFLLSIALMKPHFSLPFLGCFLFGEDRKRVWDALTFTLLFWLVSSWWLQESPTHLFAEFYSLLKPSLFKGDSLINLFPYAFPGFHFAGELWAILCAAFFLSLLYRFRESSKEVSFAIAAVGARVWTYHAYYDNVLLAFLLVPLLQRKLWVPFILVGFTLWLPPSWYAQLTGPGIFQFSATLIEHGIWLWALFVLLKWPLEKGILGKLRG